MKQPLFLAICLSAYELVSSQACYSDDDVAAGLSEKAGRNVNRPDAKASVDSGYGQYAYVGYYPVSSDSPPLGYRSISTDSMSLETCSNYCQGSKYFSLTKGDACACGPPVSNGAPTHNPPSSLPCSGNDAESCGAPGSAIVYNLQGSSGVTINSNSGSDNNSDNNSDNGNNSGNGSGNDSGNNNGNNSNNGKIPSSSSSGTVATGPPPFPGGPPPPGRSGPAEFSPDSTSSAVVATTTPQDTSCLEGDYHTPILSQASCPSDDFTQATDPYLEATVYNISCRTTLGGDSLPPVHADNFDACLHFCDTYRGCVGVSYVNATNAQASNCVAYRSFMGCRTAPFASNGYIAAATANGPNAADHYQAANTICRNTAYHNASYIDPATKDSFKISCNNIYTNTTNLPPAAVDSFKGCVAYCAQQSACQGVLFAGFGPPSGGNTNCYPYSSAGGSLQQYNPYSVASRVALI